MLKVVTVDDSAVVADRLLFMLSEVDDVKVIGNACTISEAHDLIEQLEPNVAILDIHLKDDMKIANGMHLLLQLKKKYPVMTIIMLTNLSGPQYRNTCMTFGADYFFDKTNDFERIPGVLKELQSQRKTGKLN